MYDCAIIGTGPAGLSAAINLKLHNKNFILFGSRQMSNKVAMAEKVANYPGFSLISGPELAENFQKHAKEMELEITDKMVGQIMASKRGFTILADNDIYQAKTVILAMGVVTSKEIPGEKELLGAGVSYCATCDGFLYKEKTIGVVCTDKRFEHEIIYLSELAKKVYLFPAYKHCTIDRDNVEIIDQKISQVNGEKKVSAVTLRDETLLPLDGLFCLRSAIAPTTLLPGLAVEEGLIPVDRAMATNISGCYACGDCTGTPYQYAKAVGEGNVAAHSVIRYLSEQNEK